MPSRRPVLVLTLAALLAACSSPEATSPAPATTETTAEPTAAGTTTPASDPTATPSPQPEPTDAATALWSQLQGEGGPAAREDHTWRVDGEGAIAYLFGGRDGATAFDDLWAYDLEAASWTELQPEGGGPPARFGHEAAWVDGIGLVIFAGQVGTTFFDDLWAYDPDANAWTELPAAGAVPVARYGSCAAVGPDGRLWISHGFTQDQVRFNDTRAYDFDAGAWTDETPDGELPVNRCLHGCWWTDGGDFVLYAGQTTGVTALDDLWSLRRGDGSGGHAWQRYEGERPPARNLYAATRVDDATWIFGGQAIDQTYLADLWRIDDAPRRFVLVDADGTAPPGRSGGELIYDAERGRLLVFGGRDASGAFADLWELDLAP